MGFLTSAIGTIVGYLGGGALVFGGMFTMIQSQAIGGGMAIAGIILFMWGERCRRSALGG